VDEFEAAARTARANAWAVRGAMTAGLKTARDRMAPGAFLDVIGWLAVSEPPPNRAAPDIMPIRREIDSLAARAQSIASGRPGVRLRNPPGAPLIYATVDAATLDDLAFSGMLYQLEIDPGPGHPTNTTWHQNVGAHIPNTAGWNGNGRRVAIMEGSQPDSYTNLSGIVATASPSGGTWWHTRWTTGIVREVPSPFGIAPSVGILIANWDGFGPGTVQQWALDNGADVINFSWSFNDGSNGGLSSTDLYHDWLILQFPYSLFSSTSGNIMDSAKPYIQNRSYNALIVGATDTVGTEMRSDDVMASFSSWRNHSTTHGDRELPEIVAPGTCVTAGGVTCENGTSAAAPIVSGAIALVRHRNPFGVAAGNWPEAQKAMLMATADCDRDGVRLDLSDTTDDRDGVGILNVARAVALANPANANFGNTPTVRGFRYGSMNFSTDFTGAVWNVVPKVQTGATGWISIVLTWDATPNCPTPTTCTGSGPDADLDLTIFNDATGAIVSYSASWDNNYEVLIRHLSPNTAYRLQVSKVSNRTASTYYGLAWDVFADGCPDPT